MTALPGPAGELPTGRTLTLALLTAIYVFNFMDRQILGVLAEPIKHELDLSDSQLGLLSGFMFAVFYTTFGVPVAWLADRTRRTWVVAGACALWSLFSAACGLAWNFTSLAAARIGVAVGEAGGVPPSYSLIADFFPAESRARAIAIYSLGTPLGVGLGTAIGGWIAASYGWRMAFFVVAAPGLLLTLALLAFGREPARHSEVPLDPTARGVSLSAAIGDFARSPALVAVSLASGLGAFTCYGLMAWLSAYMIRVMGMTLTEVGSWLSVTLALGLAAGLYGSGWLADRFGTRDRGMYAIVPGVALGLGAPALLAATAVTDWRLALPLFGLTLGLSVSYLPPAVTAVQALTPPGQRSTAGALLLLCLNLIGLGGGPWAIGAVSDWALLVHGIQSLHVAFQAVAGMFVIAFAAHLVAARLLRRAIPPPPPDNG